MTNKEAIQVLRRTAWLGGETYGLQNRAEQVAEAIRMAISALQELDKNPTKPNNSTEKVNNSNATKDNSIKNCVKGMTACRVPEDDTISRTDAIELIESTTWHDPRDTDVAHEVIGMLPSVQPEIIRCRDCKYFIKDHGCSISPIHKVISKPDYFCSRAKRRTDGLD